jgi:hypothetical protein
VSNRLKLAAFVCLALLLLPCGGARTTTLLAQSGRAAARAEQFVMPLHGEGFIAFRVEAAPTADAPQVSLELREIQASVTPQTMLADNHVVHRVLVDAEGGFVFGYDLVVEPLAATKQFRVSVKPVSAEFEEELRVRHPPTGTSRAVQNVSTLPRPTEAQLIDDGDSFALDLLVNPQAGVKIVDVVKVSFDRARLWSAPPRSVPLRDFTLGNVELAVRDHRLKINGEFVGSARSSSKPARGCAGALVWFYVPGRGRFIFSLIPHEGYDFQKVGRIETNKISFTLGGDAYEWTSSAPIVGTSGGNWNLWVLHDAGYVSDFDSQEQIVEGLEGAPPAPTTKGAASPEWLRDSLRRVGRERRAEFETRDDRRKRDVRHARVLVGGADRIENLLPKR